MVGVTDYRHIETERLGRMQIVRLNRPRYRNAQSRRMLEELVDAFDKADLDNDIHVIILAANGEHFSSGHDLGTPEEVADGETKPFGDGLMAQLSRSWRLYVDYSLRLRDTKKPTIAQVQGYCIFGGFLIASCMDVIVAAENAMFLPSHLQLCTTPWDLGVRNAKHILFENRFIDAQEAKRLGLVSEIAPVDRLAKATMALAERWAENDLVMLRMLKQSINGAQDAMGYRNALQAAHSNYMILQLGLLQARAPDILDKSQLDDVQAALSKLTPGRRSE